jgi:hypothetical protein
VNQIEAMRATLALAMQRDYQYTDFETKHVDWDHLSSMLKRIDEDSAQYSEAKIGRWLGYIQGVLVANDCLTLDECKDINMLYSNEDNWYQHKARGTFYQVIAEARFNTTAPNVKEWRGPVDGDMLTLYRGQDGVYSVRAIDEFNDGRFVKVREPK